MPNCIRMILVAYLIALWTYLGMLEKGGKIKRDLDGFLLMAAFIVVNVMVIGFIVWG